MARSSYLLLGLISFAITASAQEPFDQERQNRDATCDNDCFFGSFPGGSCTNDPACLCNLQKYRERYYCCMAKKCDPAVIGDSVPRHFLACEAHGVPIPEDFDTEGVCGITLPSTSSTTSSTVYSTASSTATSGADPALTTDTSPGSDQSSDATGPSATGSSGDDSSLASRSIKGSSTLLYGLGSVIVIGLGLII
ncbi:uncharacterized protein DNG_04331 [Cephalotrichum gorgonifer]|uniref:Extracellular membrane protein CFEM domain-containing protein n=1 Tax=Cephalotrichum gorgonifer TaxID=2041049 RepID=A0AAE8MYC7_9PEZI|nr:uncharacterized protein DNG_04331 [Cephalotrichum gorgonifer]